MNSDSLNMVSRLGEGHMPGTFFVSEPQLKTTVRVSVRASLGNLCECLYSVGISYFIGLWVWGSCESEATCASACASRTHGAQCARKWNFVQKIEIKIVTKQQKTGKHVENQKLYLVSH